MKVLIAGGSGLIGKALTNRLLQNGDEVWILSRTPDRLTLPKGANAIGWDGKTQGSWVEVGSNLDAWVNLTGENLGAGRWTKSRKARIRASRLDSGQVMVAALTATRMKPGLFIQASAVGFYGTRSQIPLDETSPAGDDYLARLAVEWEASTAPVDALGIRRVVIRTGVVLDKEHGALPPMVLQAKLFAGGPIGNGQQWLSWIHLADEVGAIMHLLHSPIASGVYNLTAPHPATNADFMRTLCQLMKRPYWLPVPAFALRLLLGEMSTLVVDGQRVLPNRLIAGGFTFQYPELKAALMSALE